MATNPQTAATRVAKAKADLRLKEANADLRELDYRRRVGELVEREIVAKAWEAESTFMASLCLSLPKILQLKTNLPLSWVDEAIVIVEQKLHEHIQSRKKNILDA